jgi:hypothetical protein
MHVAIIRALLSPLNSPESLIPSYPRDKLQAWGEAAGGGITETIQPQ